MTHFLCRFYIGALFLLAGLCGSAFAQTKQLPIEKEYTIRRWGVENGLPEGMITSITQFPDGFIWLTTPRHVVRFDGVTFESMAEADWPTNHPVAFSGLYRDRQGGVWVLGKGGVMRCTGGVWTTIAFRGMSTGGGVEPFWIRETPDGRVVAATSAGVYRFDGTQFVWVPIGDACQSGDWNGFTSSTMDGSGVIWLAGGVGLTTFDGTTYRAVDLPPDVTGDPIVQVFAGRGRAVWIKRLDGKSFRFESGVWTEIPPPGLRFETILETPDGTTWVGAVEGLFRWERGPWDTLNDSSVGHPSDVRAFFRTADGSLWVGTGNGLYQLRRRVVSMIDTALPGKPKSVTALLPVGGNEFWMGMRDQGLLTGAPGRFHSVALPKLPGDVAVSALLRARNGDLWAAFEGRHLMRITEKGTVRLYRSQEGSMSRGVTCLLEDRHGELWVGTRDGLMILRRDWLRPISEASGTILALGEDSAGRVWAGSQSDGLWLISTNGVCRVFRTQDGLPSDTVRLIHCDKDGVMWLGTPKGLGWIQTTDDRLQTADGMAGVGFATPPVAPEPGSRARPSKGEENPEGAWRAEPATPRKRPAPECGLAGSPFQKIINFTREQGLPNEDIRQLLDDGNGNLWIGTRQEIYRLAKSECDRVAAGGQLMLNLSVFGREEGVDAELTGGDHGPLAARLPDGTLWFSTRAGLAKIDPALLPIESPLSPVYIEGVGCRSQATAESPTLLGFGVATSARSGPAGSALQTSDPVSSLVEGRACEPGVSEQLAVSLTSVVCGRKSHSFPPGARDIEVRFTTPSYAAPERVLFRTRLDGYDAGWSLPTLERRVRYSRLPPGVYRLRVMAGGGDGGWRESAGDLRIIIEPHFWETWWFLTLAGLLALTLVGVLSGFLVRRRGRKRLEEERLRALARERVLEHEKAVEQERARIARDVHDEIGAGLTEVAMQSDWVRRDIAAFADGSTRKRMENVCNTAVELVRSVDEIVWAVNPANDTVERFVNYLTHYTERFLGATGSAFRVDVAGPFPTAVMAGAVRHGMFQAVREALNNAVKHAGAGTIELSVCVENGCLMIVVSDDGCGFDAAAVAEDGTSEGLGNMRSRMEKAGGRFELVSRTGNGTRVTFGVRL